MKKHILLGAALLSLFAASCSNDDIINNDNEVVNGKTITLYANINNGTDTRLTYNDDNKSSMKVTWSNSESFTMYKDTITDGSTFSNSSDDVSKFKGNNIEGEGTYYAVYGKNITNAKGVLTVNIANQVGSNTENGITEFMLAETDKLTGATLNFNHMLSVLKLNLKLPEEATGKVDRVIVAGVNYMAGYVLKSREFKYLDRYKTQVEANNGGKGFTISDNKILAYVAVFPENTSAKSVTITAFVGGDEYSYTINNDKQLESGKVTPVNVTLVKKTVATNYKAVYTASDYYQWDAYKPYQKGSGDWGPETPWCNPVATSFASASASCKDCPTPQQAVAYLKAGAYWDDSKETDGMKLFQCPDNVTGYHTGLWLKKKHLIPNFYTQTDISLVGNGYVTKMSTLDADEVKRIRTCGDYFFLPAAGNYSTGGAFLNASLDSGQCWYWLRMSFYNAAASTPAYGFYLGYTPSNDYSYVNAVRRDLGCMPLIAE